MDFIIDRAVSHGQTAVGGLCQMSSIRWADGSERPWIDGIDPALLDPLIHFCRMCCIVFLYMFCNLERSEAGFLIDCCRCFERARSLASDPPSPSQLGEHAKFRSKSPPQVDQSYNQASHPHMEWGRQMVLVNHFY